MSLIKETREDWNAALPKGRRYDTSREGVALHYPGASAKFRSMSHSQHKSLVKAWQYDHMVNRNSLDLQYGSVLCPCGKWMEGRTEWDNPLVRVGSNGTLQSNYRYTSISIMLGTDESITEQEKQWVGEAVAWLRSQGYGNAVVGHRDTFPTACPGNSIYQAIPDIKKYAAGGVPEEPEEPEIERTPDMAFVTSVGSRRQLHYENGITVAITDTEATALKKAGLPMAGLSTASFNSFRSVGQVVLSAFDRQGEQVSNVNLTNINPPLSEDE